MADFAAYLELSEEGGGSHKFYEVEIQGQIVKIPAALVREVRAVSPLPLPGNPDAPDEWPADPNRVGYFYAPSAFTLGAGRGYLSQKELAVTAAAFGVTDFFDIQVGTIIPTLFIEDSQVAMLGGKLGGKLTPWLRIGGGTQVFFTGGEQIGFLFGNATIGDEDRNLTVGGGVATNFDFASGDYIPVFVLAGNYRLGAKTALVTENWLVVPPPGVASFLDSIFLPTGGVRLFGPAFAVDLGLGIFKIQDSPVIPFPWVGFTWNWELPYADRLQEKKEQRAAELPR
jgi:hypothetical protein